MELVVRAAWRGICTARGGSGARSERPSRAFYRRYGFTETTARTTSSLNDLPELRLALQIVTMR